MKNLFNFLFIAAIGITVAACSNDDLQLGTNDSQSLNGETATDAYFQDIDDLTSTLASTADITFGGRTSGLDDRFCSAAKVTLKKKVSSDPDSLVVDFGTTGCTDNRGNTRTGVMIMTYTTDRKVSHSVSFINFFINGRKVEGTRTVTRTSISPLTSTVTMTGGKITWPDGTFATREASHTRVWNRSLPSSPDDNMVIKQGGTASGTNRSGKNYSTELITDITFKFGCNQGTKRILIPVSGTKVITVGDKTITIDFGDGTCDDKATVTVNGESKEITLKGSDD